MIIAIDVDMTVTSVVGKWTNWLRYHSESFDEVGMLEDFMRGEVYYELPKYCTGLNVDPMVFWEQHDLYDDVAPINGSVNVINKWIDQGHEIVFVSACCAGHAYSKHRFLQRWWPRAHGFISTENKGYVKCDMLIDDRNNFLNQMDNDSVHLFKIKTPDTQDEILVNDCISVVDFYEIDGILSKIF